MRKVFILVAALAMAAGVGVFWQPVAATAADPVTPAGRHPTARACPDHGKLLVCFAIRQTDTVQPNLAANVVPSGYGPADLRSAYNLTGSGSAAMTVAIVDAYNDPNAESDLATYRSTFGLPPCTTTNGCFRKLNQNGQTGQLPRADFGWAGEISLDLDMASAICPNCHILLVEANSPTIGNLGTAVNTAVSLGAKFVSNSYGGSETGFENSYDSSYYYNHPGVVITASSGDTGFGVSYPASGKGVTAVGGTSLVRNSSVRGWSETVWNGAGSGCSGFVAKPAFQAGLSTGCARRAEADVAAVADPQTGVAVYQTYGASGWQIYGGTSVAAPIIASVYALAGDPGASDSPNSYPYAHTSALNDVTSGNNGNCGAPLCTAGAGYDGPTGLGTPQGTSAFARPRTASSTTLASSANPATFGQPVTFTAAVNSTGTPTGSVTFSSDGNPLGTIGLTGGQATLTTSALPAGPHTITANYGGDPAVSPSSATLTQTVNTAATTTALTSSANPALPGQAVTLTATVTSPAGTPTGQVTFTSDGTALGTVSLTGGQATLTTSALAIGGHSISAGYGPDPNFATSSATLAFVVDRITYAVRQGSNISRSLAPDTLLKIYQCDSTLPPNTFEPLLPQFGSGARKFFLEQVLQVPGGDRPTYTTEFPCVKQADLAGNPLLENTGNLLGNDRQIEPYSVAAWIAQVSDAVPDVHGITLLGNIGGTTSLMQTASAAGSYPVFNVVPDSDIGAGTVTDQVFVGPTSQICSNTDTIKRFGFGINPDCGSTSIKTDP
ncbi:MAG: Ig-like domain repeat protein [Pseudonocardiaceae bacterium]